MRCAPTRFELHNHYDVVVISDQVGLRKPDPEIFTLTLKRLDPSAEQCVFVDDVARYLPPARAMGMTTIHATDPATTVTELARLFGDHWPATEPTNRTAENTVHG